MDVLGVRDAVCVYHLYSSHAVSGKEIQILERISLVQVPELSGALSVGWDLPL